MKFAYLLLILSCYAFPLFYTVIHRKMLSRLGYKIINPTVLLAAVPFLIWDYFAIQLGHWSFNPKYVLGINIFSIPVEEFLFFLLIPQSCLLIWVALKKYHSFAEVKKDILHHFKK